MLKVRQQHPSMRNGHSPIQTDPVLERSFRGHKGAVTAMSFKPSMTQLATSSEDNTVMIWNFKPQLRAYRFAGHKAAVTCVDFSPNGNILASSSKDKTVRLWAPTVKADVTVFQAHTSGVRSVQFSNDGHTLLSTSEDKTIKTKFNGTLQGHTNWVRSAKFSPDSRLVVSASDDKTVRLWDLRSKKCVKTYTDHYGPVNTVAFHPSGTVFASGSVDKTIKLFDLRTHTLIQHYSDAHVTSLASSSSPAIGGVNSINFGGNAAEWLISTGIDGLVKIWDIKEGHLHFTLHAHKGGPTTCAEFSPDSDFFATAGVDSVVMVWKANFTKEFDDKEEHASEKEDGIIHGTLPAAPAAASLPEGTDATSADKETVKKARKQTEKSIIVDAEQSQVLQVDESQSLDSFSKPVLRETLSTEYQEHNITGRNNDVDDAVLKIVDQINIMTQTMAIMEDRLTMNEDRVESIDRKLNLILDRLEQLQAPQNTV